MRRTLPTEVLLAAGGHRSGRLDGTSFDHIDSYHELSAQLEREPTWSDLVMLACFRATAMTDEKALRTALVALAGDVVAWISDLDQRHEVAA